MRVFLFCCCFFSFCETESFYVALDVLELYLDQADLKVLEILLYLPPECWDLRCTLSYYTGCQVFSFVSYLI